MQWEEKAVGPPQGSSIDVGLLEKPGHELAREPGLGKQRDHRSGEMPLPVRPTQSLIGAKRSRDGLVPSHSADSPTAAPPPKSQNERDRDSDFRNY